MTRVQHAPAQTSTPWAAPFGRHAGWLAVTAGALFLVAQAVMWTFDQRLNLETAQDSVFISAKLIYLAGFVVLLFALIAAHAWQAPQAGRFGAGAFSVAIVGTMLLAGDLWFESFAVPWLAAGPGGQALTSDPSTLMAVGAISSYLLFALGWTLFGIASARARVFPRIISISLVVGGIAGFWALLAPGGIPLGAAVLALGTWMLVRGRSSAGTDTRVGIS